MKTKKRGKEGRRKHKERGQPTNSRQPLHQIIRTITMATAAAQLLIALLVARRHQRIMMPRRRILRHSQDLLALVIIQPVAGLRDHAA